MERRDQDTSISYGPIVPVLKVTSMAVSQTFYTDRLAFGVKWTWP